MINSDKLYNVIENSFNHKFVVFPMTWPVWADKHHCYKIERDFFHFCSISTSNKIKIKISMSTCISIISPNRNKLNITHIFNKPYAFKYVSTYTWCSFIPLLYKMITKIKQTTMSVLSQYSLSSLTRDIIYLFNKKTNKNLMISESKIDWFNNQLWNSSLYPASMWIKGIGEPPPSPAQCTLDSSHICLLLSYLL